MRYSILNSTLHHSVGYSLSQNTARQAASMYMYQGEYWGANFLKGELVERSTLGLMNSGLLESGGTNWNILSPHRAGRGGIDSLLVKMDNQGRPRDLMVAEAKFGSSKLGFTKDGQQMSGTWIKPRLAKTAAQYGQLADDLKNKGFRIGSIRSCRPIVIPTQDGTAYVTQSHEQLFVQGSKGNFSALQLEKQARRMESWVRAASEGRVSIRSRLIRLSIKNNRWVVGIDRLDSVSGVTIHKTTFEGVLPQHVRRILKLELTARIRATGVPNEAVPNIVDEVIKNPNLLSNIQILPRKSWAIGIDRGMANAAVTSATFAVLIEVHSSLFTSREFDLKKIARTGLASAGSASVGYYVGSQVNARLLTTAVGRRITTLLPLRSAAGNTVAGISGMVGGIASSLAFALIGYQTGMLNERQAKITAISGGAGVIGSMAFTSVVLGGAMAFGTAGTGVAISTLSGAAATNAGLAFLGGGPIAAGGGGMALGGIVLTGGAALVGIAVCAAVSIIHSQLDEVAQERLASRRMMMVENHLKATETIRFELETGFCFDRK